jgi:predicted anti-sigma-YlaC factor YlaD
VITCARVRVLLEPYLDGELSKQDAAQVRAHLATCADCRRQHDQAMSLPFRMKALGSPAPRPSLVADVMRAVGAERDGYGRSWTLLLPEAALTAFILWYLSGLDGLGSIASGIFNDLVSLGSGSLPRVPQVDVLLLVALIALMAVAAYHLSVLVRLTPRAVAHE